MAVPRSRFIRFISRGNQCPAGAHPRREKYVARVLGLVLGFEHLFEEVEIRQILGGSFFRDRFVAVGQVRKAQPLHVVEQAFRLQRHGPLLIDRQRAEFHHRYRMMQSDTRSVRADLDIVAGEVDELRKGAGFSSTQFPAPDSAFAPACLVRSYERRESRSDAPGKFAIDLEAPAPVTSAPSHTTAPANAVDKLSKWTRRIQVFCSTQRALEIFDEGQSASELRIHMFGQESHPASDLWMCDRGVGYDL
jgi:hypothetical protein